MKLRVAVGFVFLFVASGLIVVSSVAFTLACQPAFDGAG